MNDEKVIGALITAAGMSKRMGQLKQTLPFAGSTIIETVVSRFVEAGAGRIVVVAGYRAEEVRACLKDYPVTIAENRDYASTKMFDSVKIGLKYLEGRCSRFFFTPVDVPAFNVRTLQKELDTDSPVVLPVVGGITGHPILFDARLIPDLLGHSGQGGLRGAYESLGVNVSGVEVDDEGTLYDADTPEDYRKVTEIYEKQMKGPLT